ncbi:ferredoxin reductase [Dermacoccus barathri]|uniref:ferredoxin reductase n=1 Tax=Dermacoccus barathri TaxID=322601 RepID=UPI0031F896BB
MSVTSLSPTRTTSLPSAPRTSPAGSATRLAWRAVRALTTPLVPEDYVDLVDPLRSRRYLRARVVDVTPETADASTVTLQPGRGWLGHRPGQYIRIGVDIDGVRLWRAYSVTSGPRGDGNISITVKALTGGVVSAHLQESLRPGQIVQMEQADGAFTWNGGAEPVLFVTGGSGITPVMGMLRHRIDAEEAFAADTEHAESAHDIVVLHSAAHPEDVIFADELRSLDATGRIRLVERHTQAEGRLEPRELDDLVPDWRDRTTYACGPAGMLRALREYADLNGVADHLHTEEFTVELAEPGEGGALTLHDGSNTLELDVAGDTAILDAAEAAGALVPSGCRMGICYGCVLPLRSGNVRDLRTGEITSGSEGDGVMVQTCISSVAGACEIGR